MRCRSHALRSLVALILSALIGNSLTAQAQPPRPATKPADKKPAAQKPADAKPEIKKPDAKTSPQSSDAAVRQYADAVLFHNRADYDLAQDEWQAFLKKFPQDPLASKAQFYLGMCQLQLKNFGDARTTFAAVVAKYPDFEYLDATYLNLGLANFSLAQAGKPELYDQAIEALKVLGAKFPQSKELPSALFYLGESNYARGKKDEAIKSWSLLVSKYPDNSRRADALYNLGVAQEETGKVDQAAATFESFLKDYPNDAHAVEVGLRKGNTLYSAGKFAEAEKRFAAAAAAPGFANADYATLRQAASLAEQKKYLEAAKLYVTIPAKFSKSVHVHAAELAAGNCYYLAGDQAQARNWLGKAFAAGGDGKLDAAHWIAQSWLKEHKPEQATQVIDQALSGAEKLPGYVTLLMDQADIKLEQQKPAEAAPLYAALAKKFPQDPVAAEALHLAGFADFTAGNYAAAYERTQAFFKAFPNHRLEPQVKVVAAESAMLSGKPTEAEKLYADLLAKNAASPDADNWRVRKVYSLYVGQKYSEAVTALKPLLTSIKNPDLLAEAQYLLGSSQLELKQPKEATAAFQASLKASPKWRQADETALKLAQVQQQNGDFKAARATLEKLLADFAGSKLADRATYQLGEVAQLAGDPATAKTQFQKVIDQWPQSTAAPHALFGRGKAELATQDNAAAEKSFSMLLEKHADHPLAPLAKLNRGLAREEQQHFQPALDDLNAYLGSNPPGETKSTALLFKGLCEVGLSKPADAARTFEAILTGDPKAPDRDRVLYELAWAYKSQSKDGPADSKLDQQAMARFAELAKEFPNSSYAAEANFHVGEAETAKKNFKAAAVAYETAAKKAGQSELVEKATYKLAWAQYQQENYEQAQKTFDALVAAAPNGALAPEGLRMAAECLLKQNKYQPALAGFEKALATNQLSKNGVAVAQLMAGQAAGQLKQWDAAVKHFQQITDSPYLAEAQCELGWAKQNLKQLDEALKLYEGVADGPASVVTARARFLMGEIDFERKNHKEAIRNFFKIAYNPAFESKDTPAAIRVWQANATFEAARCLEIMQKPDQAKKLYAELVANYPSSDKVTLAQDRLKALK